MIKECIFQKEMENIVLLIDDSVKAIIIFILRYNKINKEVIKMYEAIKQLAKNTIKKQLISAEIFTTLLKEAG